MRMRNSIRDFLGARAVSLWATGLSAAGRSRLQKTLPAGFTLVELLAVIAIIGLLAALVGPAIANVRKGDAMLAANRQMLGAVARARQLAMADHTTVYMVFVPTNYWSGVSGTWTFGERLAATNIADKQLIGYTFVSLRSAGDQPGQGVPRYLSQWQTLPESTFIPEWKFVRPTNAYFYLTNIIGPRLPSSPQEVYRVDGFPYTRNVPFPIADTATNGGPYVWLPYVAFNYLGQPVDDSGRQLNDDVFIPLAQGSVSQPIDLGTRRPKLDATSAIEKPPGNSTNNFNLIRIDRFTGRARLERQEIY